MELLIMKKEKSNTYTIKKSLVEKPKVSEAPSNLTVVGRYVLNAKIFSKLKKMKSGQNNEIQLTDSLNELTSKPGLKGLKFIGERFDCGNKLGFILANLKFGLNDKLINKELKKELLKKYENYNYRNRLCRLGIRNMFCRIWGRCSLC